MLPPREICDSLTTLADHMLWLAGELQKASHLHVTQRHHAIEEYDIHKLDAMPPQERLETLKWLREVADNAAFGADQRMSVDARMAASTLAMATFFVEARDALAAQLEQAA